MLASIKSEFRKLLTVRSTYVIIIISLLLIALFAGFGDGFKAQPASLRQPDVLMGESASAIVIIGLVFAFAGLLLVGHEYRYNTIMYTLTNSPSRLRSLFAKGLVVSVFAVVASILALLFSPLCMLIGAHLHGYHLAPQHFDWWTVIRHGVFVGWGYAMYAFVLAVILRNQIGSIVTFLLIPLIGEGILGHIFTTSQKYFPFSSLQAIEQHHEAEGSILSVGHSALVVLVYIVIGLVISVLLFTRRDAN